MDQLSALALRRFVASAHWRALARVSTMLGQPCMVHCAFVFAYRILRVDPSTDRVAAWSNFDARPNGTLIAPRSAPYKAEVLP
ncbi:MAG TPA: hypothetical protein VFS77_09925 [Pyrinomonadaceae bacterium]|nr:hypothetical protein [Pyrinomonadaceae bacterium]